MSVLIKGVEMPKGCATCPYCDRAWNKPKCKAKSTQGRFMEQRLNLDRTRQKWCPLVPVPPHGRLIDAYALERDAQKRLLMCDKNDNQFQKPYEVMRAIALAPTIIEAEEGE